MLSESTEHVLNEGQILILVRITPTGEDESGGNSPGEDGTSASDLQPRDSPGAGLLGREGRNGASSGPSQPQDCLPMFFFKAKHLCCQERVCLSLGDNGCQDWENSKHVKNSSASRLRGCNFLLKCRLCSRQRAGVCLCSLQPAAEAAEGSKMFARGRQRVSARAHDRQGENFLHSNSDELELCLNIFILFYFIFVIKPHQG